MKIIAAIALCVLSYVSNSAMAQGYGFEHTFKNLTFERPVLLTAAPDGSDRLFVIEQAGRVLWFENRPDVSGKNVHVALDISGAKVRRKGNEEGLLGLAFHPEFANNRYVFLHYSASSPRRNVLSRWTMDDNATRILPDSEKIILEVEQPFGNHNGGDIHFGPDGFLYISLGDGGAGGDPHGNGQNLSTLLATILRIDVDNTQDGKPYAIPENNPFVDIPGARPEIYAYGLRNVWRFSFDSKTGDLWAGDVGQNAKEEIDLIMPGGNYGWNPREGFSPYKGGEMTPAMSDPVVDHPRNEAASITGGYVYHGNAIPQLKGAYIYGDFVTGTLWRLRYDGEKVTEHEPFGKVPQIASFGLDTHGELYICSLNGEIYKLVATD
jgi:glucose/arabinose dehydrogenase